MNFKNSSHRRKNILTGEWILVSPHRTNRPWQGKKDKPQKLLSMDYDPNCYLCQGNKRAAGKKNPKSHRGSDLKYKLDITLEQSAKGFITEIKIPNWKKCTLKRWRWNWWCS